MSVWQRCTTIPRNRSIRIGVAIYLLSLGLRLAVLMELKDLPTVAQCTVLDMRGNHEFALAILQGLRPTTYYKAPFYSYFLAGIYAMAGADPFNARLVQVFLTSLTPVLTFLIGRRLFGTSVGVVAGVVASFFWTFLYFSVELLDTGLACLFHMLFAWLVLTLDDKRRSKWVLCGLVLGLGAITRPNILMFAPILAVMSFIVTWRKGRGTGQPVPDIGHRTSPGRGRPAHEEPGPEVSPPPSGPDSKPEPRTPLRAWRSAVVNVVVFTLGCCVPIAPVTLRNRLVGGEWVLLGAYGGMNLYVANNPYSDSKNGPLLTDDSKFVEPTTWDPNEVWARCCLNYYTAYRIAETKLGRAPKPGEFADIVGRMGWDFIRENPGWFARHAARRLIWLFNTMEFPSNRNLYDFRWNSRVLLATSVVQFGIICPFGLLGLWLSLSRPTFRTPGMAYYVGMLASLVFPAAMFHINVRFRVPIVHLLMPFAAFGLLDVLRLFRSDATWTRRGLIGAVLAGLVVFSNGNWFNYWDTRGIHLQWAMINACEKAGREDLLPKAVEDFEKALAECGDTSYPSDTSLVMKYGHPRLWLFRYYRRRNNLPQAAANARLMLKNERFDAEGCMDAFRMFMETNDRTGSLEAAEAMANAVGKYVRPDHAADCLLAYGRRFADPEALRRARELYEVAAHLRPNELRFDNALTEIRELLQNTTSKAHSQPATTTHSGL